MPKKHDTKDLTDKPLPRQTIEQPKASLSERIAKARQIPREKKSIPRGIHLGVQVLVELFAPIAVGGWIGWGLDRHFQTAPWLLLVFFVMGFTAGLFGVVRTARRWERESRSS
ncbi:MAG: AtpZ/AtpI family protein [Pseudomonadota bacterium]